MTQSEAKSAILSEWHTALIDRSKPILDISEFTLEMVPRYRFKCSGDPYKVVRDWLQKEINRSE
jgi:hypothetical protein